MNVLHLITGRSFTGPAAAALGDTLALRAAGASVWLGSRTGSALEAGCAEQDVPYKGGFRLGRGAGRLLHFSADARRLLEVAHKLQLDVVHVHRSDDQLLARWALRGRSRPVLVRTWHRDPQTLAGPLRRKLVGTCHAACCVARAHERLLKAEYVRAEFVPPGVDTGRFQPRAGGAAEPGAPVRIGLLGRWKKEEDRGQAAFLDVARRLDPLRSWSAALLGRGEGRADLEHAVAAHPARERLALIETGTDYPAQVAALDLGLVFATGSDGTSRAAVELLACGIPVLLADRPGLRELGEDPACARVLPARDWDAWARTVHELLDAPQVLQAMRVAARARAESVHTLAVRGAALLKLYG